MKNHLFTRLALIAAILLGMVACSPVPSSSLSVGAADSGKQVTLAVGGILTITLESNITTGYSWNENATISDRTVVNQTSHKYQPPANQIPGAGGQEVWTFTGLAPGNATISMEYKRPFEPNNPPANTFNVTVIVQ